jgi:hypothetical protein
MPVAEAAAPLEDCTKTQYGHLIEPLCDELDADRQIFGTEAVNAAGPRSEIMTSLPMPIGDMPAASAADSPPEPDVSARPRAPIAAWFG